MVQKYFKIALVLEGEWLYNFHSSSMHMHLSFKSVCNKEHKKATCNMTSSSNSSQSTRPLGWVLWENYLSCLDFTCNYELTSGIFVLFTVTMLSNQRGVQWHSGRVFDLRPRDCGFEPHQRHCVVGLKQYTFILAYYWFNPGRPVSV